jgi:hypothetical protein
MTMFPTYADQVRDATDADGMLSVQLATRLMEDHSTTLFAMQRDGYKGNCRHAESLLDWLGYAPSDED